MQFFLGVKNGLPWRCQCWKQVKTTYQYFQISFRKSRCLNARHKWSQTQGEKETLFSKILSLPICTSCMTNVSSSRRVFQHPRKADSPTVRDLNVWDGKLHEISRLMHDRNYILFFSLPHINFCVYPCMGKSNIIVNEKFQRVISSVLSWTKSFNESRVCERCT